MYASARNTRENNRVMYVYMAILPRLAERNTAQKENQNAYV